MQQNFKTNRLPALRPLSANRIERPSSHIKGCRVVSTLSTLVIVDFLESAATFLTMLDWYRNVLPSRIESAPHPVVQVQTSWCRDRDTYKLVYNSVAERPVQPFTSSVIIIKNAACLYVQGLMEDTYVRLINCRLHLFGSSAPSFSSQYLLLFVKSSRSCVLLLPKTLIFDICPSMAS